MFTVKVICKTCGKTFDDIKGIKSIRRKYCSLACYNSTRHKPVLLKCDFCGKEYKEYLSALPYSHHYCSRECYLTQQIQLHSGPLNIRSRTLQRRRYLHQFREQNGGFCVLCGGNHWPVIVHHLVATNGDEKENLCCLHRACHRVVERIAKFDKDFYTMNIIPMLKERQGRIITSEVKTIG